MIRQPISAEARRRLRAAWADLQADADRILAAWDGIPQLLAMNCLRRGQVRDRAVRRVVTAMSGAGSPVWQDGPRFGWRVLAPHAEVPGATGVSPHSDRQPAIAVELLAINAGLPKQRASFGMAVTQHALGRFVDRAGDGADTKSAIAKAHDALLTLQPQEAGRALALRNLILPAAGGAFLATPSALATGPMVVCRTWVSEEQTHARQDIDLAAWRRLMGLAGETD